MTTDRTTITRRGALVGGATAALGVLSAGTAHAAPDGSAGPKRPGGPRPHRNGGAVPVRTAALPALADDEQSYTVFGPDLSASTNDASGSAVTYVGSLDGAYPTGSIAWLGLTIRAPLGSIVTGVDATMAGNPRSGSAAVWCDHHRAESGFQNTVGYRYATAGAGVETLTLQLSAPVGADDIYEVYFSGLSATCVARAIRVRYRPPEAAGLVRAVTAVQLLNKNVGTKPVAVLVAGRGGVPAGASAVLVNVKVSKPAKKGYVSVAPYGRAGSVAIQEFAAREKVSNLALVALHQGRLAVRVSKGSARVRLQVCGYVS